MTRSRAARAVDALTSVLLLAIALALVAAMRWLPTIEAPGSGMDALRTVLTIALIVTGSVAALGMLVRGLRTGSAAALLRGGASASLAGGGVGTLLASASLPIAVLAAAAFLVSGVLAERAPRLEPRGATWLAASVVVLAEATVLASLPAVLGDASAPLEGGILVVALLAGTSATLLSTGRHAAAAGLLVVGAAALLVLHGESLEGIVALAALAGAQVFTLSAAIQPAAEARQHVDVGLPALAQRLTEAVLRFDGRLRLVDWNAPAASLLGLDASSAGARIEDLLAVSIAELPTPDGPVVAHRAVGGLEVAMHRDGDGITAMVRDSVATPETEQLGRELRSTIEELLAARRTIELQRAELERASTTDPLTGVASRSGIVDRLRVEVAQARRYRHPVTVVLADVDDFAVINRLHGIRGGDAVLREVALRMRLRVRQADALGRAGSDGFLVVLPHTDHTGASMFADAVRHRLALRPIALDDELLSVTVSIGVASMRPGEELDVDGLLARAEEALASARAAGGDRVAVDRHVGLARLEVDPTQPPAEAPEGLSGES